jgi:hypothetical protein
MAVSASGDWRGADDASPHRSEEIMVKTFALVLLSVLLVQQAQANMRSGNMLAPPAQMDSSQQQLRRSEISISQHLNDARKEIVSSRGADPASERVSRSDEFGYVFRYDVVTTENDDRGNTFRIHMILVIWSDDGKMLKLATSPTYKLPNPQ